MKTESVSLVDLCVPCACRCRYCLLSWDGKPVGLPWERGAAFAERFTRELAKERPELPCSFSFGYSMEHPELREALRFLRRIGSPQAEFLQCDGMKPRSAAACGDLARMLAEEGIRSLNFTFYGLREYHDRFAGRAGDFDLMLQMMRAAKAAGLAVSAGIPLTAESAPQADALINTLREKGSCDRVSLFIPHEEGRGIALRDVRFSEDDLARLSPDARALLNRKLYRPEREWTAEKDFAEETRRTINISLRPDNIDRYESMTPGELVAEVEALDDAYYAAFPTLPELAERYGDPKGKKFYRQRDLFHHYRRRFAREYWIDVYDVTDERQSGSRRYE